jgi:hypothetical protein
LAGPGDLFSGLSSSLVRFVYAWFVPSAAAVSIGALTLVPDLAKRFGGRLTVINTVGLVEKSIVGLLAVFLLSIVFALTSLPVYRFLEGYTMPKWLAGPLLRRQVRSWTRLTRVVQTGGRRSTNEWTQARERLHDYPTEQKLLMPTRFGNGFRALETYGSAHYGADTQLLWYEFTSLAPDSLRGDIEDARMPIDFFVSAMVHLLLLAAAAAVTAVVASSVLAGVVAAISTLLVPIAYGAAVRNIGEFRITVQALVNVSRKGVAEGFGLLLPDNANDEVLMWTTLTRFAEPGPPSKQVELAQLDRFRGQPSASSDPSR